MTARAVCVIVLLLGSWSPLAAVASNSISIDVRGVDIGDAIGLLAAQSGINVVTDGSLAPVRVTLHLHNVTFRQALEAIASSHGLAIRREGDTFVIGAAESMNRRGQSTVIVIRRSAAEDVARELTDALPSGTVVVADKRSGTVVVEGDASTLDRARRLAAAFDEGPAGNAQASLTQSYRLAFERSGDVVEKLKGIVANGGFVSDEGQNAVLVTGPGDVQAAARSVIASLDRPSAQVMFEVKVADVTPVNDTSNFGLEFGSLDANGQPLAGSLEYSFTGGTIPLIVKLNALVTQGRAAILATPKLVTINNKEADLTIGETYPIVYSTSVFGGQNVQYVDIGVHLKVTPTIGTDGSVVADLHPEYSELIGFTSTGYPIVANRKIDSTLRVADGQTIVLGGLLRDTSSQTVSKVPWLADIPVLGKLFQNKTTAHERDEIVFLITPHVFYPGSAPVPSAHEAPP